MDWFEKLTGFREAGYAETRKRLWVDGKTLSSRVNGVSYGIGELDLASLQTLRDHVQTARRGGRATIRVVMGDVREMHRNVENNGALFQVASQFNMLEMVSPDVSPEDGVTRYAYDHTQGPACAIAAGAATIYRNYFAPVGGDVGQTEHRQLDGLADVGDYLSRALQRPVSDLWSMRNGYALSTVTGLSAISTHLASLDEEEIDVIRGKLRIGIHSDVEVTDTAGPNRPVVSQAFCSALPVAYSSVPAAYWRPFATLVLEAAYEATLWAAVANAQSGKSNSVFLTLLGGGAFGNPNDWIFSTLRRAIGLVRDFDLEVNLVSYGRPSNDLTAFVEEFR